MPYDLSVPNVRHSMVGDISLDPNSWFDGARVFIPGYTETLEDSLYDFQNIGAGAIAQRRFFAEAIGGPNNRTYADTNLEQVSTLPAGEAFLVVAVGVEYYPDVPPVADSQNDFANDIYNFYTHGWLQFTINGVWYARNANLLQFAPENQASVWANFVQNQATPANAVISAQSAGVQGRIFKIVPKLIESSVTLAAVLSEIPARTNAGRVGVRLYGYRARNAQG